MLPSETVPYEGTKARLAVALATQDNQLEALIGVVSMDKKLP